MSDFRIYDPDKEKIRTPIKAPKPITTPPETLPLPIRQQVDLSSVQAEPSGIKPQQPQIQPLAKPPAPQQEFFTAEELGIPTMPTGPSRGFLADIGSSVVESGLGAVEQIARGARGYDPRGGIDVVRGLTTPVIEGLDVIREKTPFLQPSREAQKGFRRAATEGVKALGPSLASVIPGAFIGGLAAGPAGAFAGALTGGALTGGGAEYDRALDEAVEAYTARGIPESKALKMAKKYAKRSALIEAGIETAANVPELLTLGLGRAFTTPLKSIAKQSIKKALRPGIARSVAQIAKTIPMELASEGITAALQAQERQKAGLPTEEPMEAFLSSLGPTAVMSTLFGVSVSTMNASQRRGIEKALVDPSVDIKNRMSAVSQVHSELRKSNPVAAEYWQNLALAHLQQNAPIDVVTPIQQQLAEATGRQAEQIMAARDIAVGREPGVPERLQIPYEPQAMPVTPEGQIIAPETGIQEIARRQVLPEEERYQPLTENEIKKAMRRADIGFESKAARESFVKAVQAEPPRRIRPEDVGEIWRTQPLLPYTPQPITVTPEGQAVTPEEEAFVREEEERLERYEPLSEEEIRRAGRRTDIGFESKAERESFVKGSPAEIPAGGKGLYDEGVLTHAKSRIQSGEAPATLFEEGEGGVERFERMPSTFPDWFKNKGYTKKGATKAIDKALTGKALTKSERSILDDLNAGAEKEVYGDSDKALEAYMAGTRILAPEQIKEGDIYRVRRRQLEVEGFKQDGVDLRDTNTGETFRIAPERFAVSETVKEGEGQTLDNYLETLTPQEIEQEQVEAANLPELPRDRFTGQEQVTREPGQITQGDIYRIGDNTYRVEDFDNDSVILRDAEDNQFRYTDFTGQIPVDEVVNQGTGQTFEQHIDATPQIGEAFKIKQEEQRAKERKEPEDRRAERKTIDERRIPAKTGSVYRHTKGRAVKEEKKAVRKDSYEKTFKEYSKDVSRADLPAAKVTHKRTIRAAIDQGKRIPEEVLNEYPDIQRYSKQKAKAVPAEAQEDVLNVIQEQAGLTPAQRVNIKDVQKRFIEISEEVKKILPLGSMVRMRRKITPSARGVQQAGLERGKAVGRHIPLANMTSLIELSTLDLTAADLDKVTFHETFHSVQSFMLNNRERAILEKTFPAQRTKTGVKVTEEVQADAFAEYVTTGRIESINVFNRKGVYGIFDKIKRVVDRLRNWLQGNGYNSIQDIFRQAKKGELTSRVNEIGYELSPEIAGKAQQHYGNPLLAEQYKISDYAPLWDVVKEYNPFRNRHVIDNAKELRDAMKFSHNSKDMTKLERLGLLPRGKAKIYAEFKKLLDVQMTREENRSSMMLDLMTKNPSFTEVANHHGVDISEVRSKAAKMKAAIKKARESGDFEKMADLQMEHDRYTMRTQHSVKQPHEFLQLDFDRQESLFKLMIKSDAEQRVMNVKELEENGMDSEQIGAYFAWHKTMKRALKMMVEQAEQITYLPYKDKKWVPLLRRMTRNDENLKAMSIMHKEWKNGKPAKLDKFAEDHNLDAKERLEFVKAFAVVNPTARTLKNLRNKVGEVAFYIPRIREGKYAVRVMDKEGKVIHHERATNRWKARAFEERLKKEYPESEGYQIISGEDKFLIRVYNKDGAIINTQRTISQNDAAKAKAEMESLYPASEGYKIEEQISSYSPLTEGLYQEINDAAIQKFLERAITKAEEKGDIDPKDAQALTSGLISAVTEEINKRGFGRHKIARVKDRVITGYKTDEGAKLFLRHIAGLSGYLTKQKAAYNFYAELQKFPADKPELFVDGSTYVKDMLRNSTDLDITIAKVKNVIFAWYLAGNIKSAAVQMTQNFILGMPQLAREIKNVKGKSSIAEAEKRYLKAMKDLRTELVPDEISKRAGWTHNHLTKEEADFINDMLDQGIATDQYIKEIMESTIADMSTPFSKAVNFLARPFSGMEIYNRKSALLAMYRLQKEQGVSEKTAREKAKDFMYDTHFLIGKANKPSWATGEHPASKVFNLAYTFRSFTQNYFESLLFSLRKDAAGKRHFDVLARSLAWTMIIGGISALPFADDLLEILEKLTGKPLRADIRKTAKDSAIGDIGANLLFEGLPSVVGIDISGSLAVGLPSLNPSELDETLAGVYGGMFKKAYNSYLFLQRDDVVRAIESLSPAVIENPLKALRLTTKGAKGRTGKDLYDTEGHKIKLSTWGFVLQFAGFRPEDISNPQKVQWSLQTVQNVHNQRRFDLLSSYRNADNTEEKREALKDIQEFNKRALNLDGLIPPITQRNLKQAVTQKPERRKVEYYNR